MVLWRSIAAANNAEWCDTVCRAHGMATRIDEDAWTSRARTPVLYPDAVTLVQHPSVPDLLARIDASAGCSIKDSFTSLDLTALGFRVLFRAEWIVRTTPALPPIAVGPHWEVVRDRAAFTMWEQARLADGSPSGGLPLDVLHIDSVTVLAARVRERIVGGAVLNHGAGAVGITNFFADPPLASVSWAGCIAVADALFPGSVLVGYEAGHALDAARCHGFETAGPLCVWLRDG